jgi:hypothetical protein
MERPDRPPGWRRLFRLRDRDIEAAIDDELRFHLDMRTEEQVRWGLSEGEARRAALARLEMRRCTARWARSIVSGRAPSGAVSRNRRGQDMAYAFRALAASAVRIHHRALPRPRIGAATTVFSVGDAYTVHFLSEWCPLVQVGTVQAQVAVSALLFEDYTDWRERQRTFDALRHPARDVPGRHR